MPKMCRLATAGERRHWLCGLRVPHSTFPRVLLRDDLRLLRKLC